jgi:hypothetical protein
MQRPFPGLPAEGGCAEKFAASRRVSSSVEVHPWGSNSGLKRLLAPRRGMSLHDAALEQLMPAGMAGTRRMWRFARERRRSGTFCV